MESRKERVFANFLFPSVYSSIRAEAITEGFQTFSKDLQVALAGWSIWEALAPLGRLIFPPS